MIHRLTVVPFGLVLLAACARRSDAPPLPVVDTSGFQPAVREAVESARRVAESKPDDAAAAARFCMVLHAHEQWAAAAACYRRAEALDPKVASAPYLLGLVLARDGKYDDAAVALRRAIDRDPASLPTLIALGDALFSAGKTEEARKAYRDAISRDPSVAAGHFGLGRTLDGREAEAELRRALELFPRYGGAQFALAALLRKSGRGAEAEQVLQGYEQNKTLAPPLPDPLLDAVSALDAGATGLLSKAQSLEREGRLAEAAEFCERAVTEMPKLDQAWVNLISLYGRLGDGAKVENAYRQAIAIAPNRADAYYNYGVWCARTEKWEAARTAFEKTVALDPAHADALNNLGSLVERSGALDRAANLFRRAIAARPEFPMAHFHLGRIYANQRKYPAAIAELEQSISPAGEATPTYRYALAATYARSGNRAKAVELMRIARAEGEAMGQAPLVAAIDRDLARLMR